MLWLFLLIVLPCALLLSAEGALRLSGYGHSTDVFLKRTLSGKAYWVLNKHFLQQFFSLPIERLVGWEDYEFIVPAEKAKGVKRVVVLGSSAANGMPPDTAFSMPRMLEAMLRMKYPDLPLEIYNAACPGMNSHVMAEVAREAAAKLQPDLFLVYMGNNEFIGPYGPGALVAARYAGSEWFIRANMVLSDLRLLQLVRGPRKLESPTLVKAEDILRLLIPMPLDDPRREVAYARYEANLRSICNTARAADTPVLLCTVGVNRCTWGPFQSLHSRKFTPEEDVEWNRFDAEATAIEDANKGRAAAVAPLERMTAMDSGYAQTWYRLGRALRDAKDYARAAEAFDKALEANAVAARANSKINAAVERVAKSEPGVEFADVAGALRESANPDENRERYFYDDVHLTYDGNRKAARMIFPVLSKSLTMTGNIGEIEDDQITVFLGYSAAVLYNHAGIVLSILPNLEGVKSPCYEECLQSAKIGVMALKGWAGVDPKKTEIEGYQEALKKNPGDYFPRIRLVRGLMEKGEVQAAADEAKTLLEYHPARRAVRREYAKILAAQGKQAEAQAELDQLLRDWPDDAEAWFHRGNMAQAAGDAAGALKCFQQAAEMNPFDDNAVTAQASVLEQQGKMDAALETYRSALRINVRALGPCDGLDRILKTPERRVEEWRKFTAGFSNIAEGHARLARALVESGDVRAAAEAYAKAEEYDPKFLEEARKVRHIVAAQDAAAKGAAGDWPGAMAMCRTGLESVPYNAEFHYVLAQGLENTGDIEGAYSEYATAAHYMNKDPRPFNSFDALTRKSGDPASRITRLRDFAERCQYCARASFLLAGALQESGDLKGAEAAFARAVELDAADPAMQAGLGEVRVALGDTAGAVVPLRMAIKLNPDITRLYPILLECLITLDSKDEARGVLAEARKRGIVFTPELEAQIKATGL